MPYTRRISLVVLAGALVAFAVAAANVGKSSNPVTTGKALALSSVVPADASVSVTSSANGPTGYLPDRFDMTNAPRVDHVEAF